MEVVYFIVLECHYSLCLTRTAVMCRYYKNKEKKDKDNFVEPTPTDRAS